MGYVRELLRRSHAATWDLVVEKRGVALVVFIAIWIGTIALRWFVEGGDAVKEELLTTFAFGVGASLVVGLAVFFSYFFLVVPRNMLFEQQDANDGLRTDISGLQTQIQAEKNARETAVNELKSQIEFMQSPRFEIECGEGTTMLEGKFWYDIHNVVTGGVSRGYDRIAFFGFRLWNRGAQPARKCRVRLVGISKNGKPLSTAIAALGFESDNPGDDLEECDLYNDVPGRLSVFSIFHSGARVAAGSGNLKWRHEPIESHFKEPGIFEFLISISYDAEGDDQKLTQQERFACHWGGSHTNSSIEYLGTNHYSPSEKEKNEPQKS
jgi:hypothetical protein